MTLFRLLVLFIVFSSPAVSAPSAEAPDIFRWNELPPLPDSLGLGGPFAGVAGGALIVAGGANFPEEHWGEGEKVWRDGIYVLEPGGGTWKTGFRLPSPRAYGVSITTGDGLICVGGSDSKSASREVFLLQWKGGRITTTRLPDLPEPRAAASGGIIGNTVFIACGQTSSAETEVTGTLWMLKLPGEPFSDSSARKLRWEILEPLPGPPRAQAPAAVQDGRLYIFSGFTLTAGPDGNPKRRYLADAYSYCPGKGWERIADVPRPVAAAPAVGYGDSHIFVFGGHDGSGDELVGVLKDKWPGFRRDVLAYHTITDTWTTMGTVPVGAVTTGAVKWRDGIIIPSGEVRPRVRTDRVFRAQVSSRKTSFGALNSLFLGLYLASLVAMGFYFSRREKTTSDFFLGGHRVPWWAAGLSIFGTQLSSISFMAVPAKVYATDWTYFVGFICIVLVQPVVIFFYLPFFRRLNITSAYDYLEKRFNPAVRLMGSLSFVLFQTGRMTIVLFLPALALSAVTGIDIFACIVVMGVLATLYTVLGGIEAVIWTDVLQVVVLIGGAFLSLVLILLNVDGGLAGVVKMGAADGKFTLARLGWDYTAPVLWIIFIGGLFQNMVSYSADQAVIQRYLTTRDEKTAARAIWTNAVMILPIACIWFSLGTALYAFYKTHPQLLDPTLLTDQTFPLFIAQQLPDGVVGIVIAGLFAASMSTVDSSLNSISTVVVTDFYGRLRRDTDDPTCLAIARSLTVLFGLAATGIAMWMATNENIMSLWDIYLTVLGLVMGSLTGLFALGIFTERTTSTGALTGAFGGAAVLYIVQRYTDLHFYIYAGVGITACFVIGYAASFVLPAGGKSTTGLTIYSGPARPEKN